MKSIKWWQKHVMDWCERKGWNENLVLGNMIANLMSEVSEAWEEIRNGHTANETYTSTEFHRSTTGLPNIEKPEGFPIELADLFIRLVHLCEVYNIDLEAMVKYKMAYNEKRPYRHGGKTA